MLSNLSKTVPKPVKNRLWDTTFGPEAGQGNCYVCGVIINSKSFEAGHVKAAAKGGLSTVENLRCICSDCNKSMGTHNLEVFKAIYFPNRVKNKTKCTCNCDCTKKDVLQKDVLQKDVLQKDVLQKDFQKLSLKEPKYVKVGPFRKEVRNNINYYEYKPDDLDITVPEEGPMYDEDKEKLLIHKIKKLDQFMYKKS